MMETERNKKKSVTFGVTWKCYGYQTVELPDEIDATDHAAILEHLKSKWDYIPIPTDGDYIPQSDEIDPEATFCVIMPDPSDPLNNKVKYI